MLAARDLRRSVASNGAPRVLFDRVDVELRGGELVLLRGPSGSGKTSLLRSLVGLDPLDRGSLRLDGAPLSQRDGVRLRRAVCYVAQAPRVAGDTVATYLAEPSAFAAHAAALDDAARDRGLEALSLGPDLLAAPTTGLSGGERKRLALLRALLYRPRGLLLDEPTAGLDPTRVEAVLGLVRAFLRQGGAAVIASHELTEAELAPQRLWLLEGGALHVRAPDTEDSA